MLFRFANTVLEPIWIRNYVANVQVTMAERATRPSRPTRLAGSTWTRGAGPECRFFVRAGKALARSEVIATAELRRPPKLRRFARQGGVEEAWRIVEHILDLDDQPHSYQPGSWGPTEASDVLGDHRWHQTVGEA